MGDVLDGDRWEAYFGSIFALTADENGDKPATGSYPVGDVEPLVRARVGHREVDGDRWEAYFGSIFALTADENGDKPATGSYPVGDVEPLVRARVGHREAAGRRQ